jgi:hypothetical protein
MQNLTRDNLKRLANVLEEAIEIEGFYDGLKSDVEEFLRNNTDEIFEPLKTMDTDTLTDFIIDNVIEFGVSTYTGKSYTVTLNDLKKGNVMGLAHDPNKTKGKIVMHPDLHKDVSSPIDYYKSKPLGDSVSYKLTKFDSLLERLNISNKSILKENLEGRLAESNAREIFGSDDEPGVRGYIYQDGTFLNLGSHQDHREINFAYYPDEETGLKEINVPEDHSLGSSRLMIHFMTEAGAVRWARVNKNYLVMSYIQKPTSAQKRAITKIIDTYNISEVSVDVYSPRYETLKSAEGDVWDDDVQRLI